MGIFASSSAPCSGSCIGEVCLAPDCAEWAFRRFSTTAVTEGAVNSSSSGQIDTLSWRLDGVHCTIGEPGEMVLTDSVLGTRKIPFQLSGSRLITGSGVVWLKADSSQEMAVERLIQ